MTQHQLLTEHRRMSRRFFTQLLTTGSVAAISQSSFASEQLLQDWKRACEKFLQQMEYLTPQDKFGDVSRGNPLPYKLSDEKKSQVGLTPESWKLEVTSDPEHPADIEQPLSIPNGNAFDWQQLMELAKSKTVSFGKVMTCNNMARPLGMGFWEGIPLRDIIWKTRPKKNVRRLFYHGYHNDDPKQIFRSSLPIGRVLEDPPGLPPVILCYKLNGTLLNSQRGGPVRIVVPEAYGFKSVKWLNRIVLSNLYHANDTYAEQNNDIDSWMKTFAQVLMKPETIKANEPIPLTGWAQVGISNLSRVQTLILPRKQEWPVDDPYFTKAAWKDAHLLPAPDNWGSCLPENQLPKKLFGYENDKPKVWPMRLCMAHWATVLPGLPAGKYSLRCRSIDEHGHAQPMPRPFRKSGRNAIEEIKLNVQA